MYKITYLPLMLIFYSVGTILFVRMGRLSGGWLQPMNDWYAFHLYFYLIGVLWILFFDILKKYIESPKKSFKFWIKNNFWTLMIFVFSLCWIFSFKLFSNVYQWRRSVYIKEWFEVKKQAILNPTNENLDVLLWPKEKSLEAITVLKENKLSVFRDN